MRTSTNDSLQALIARGTAALADHEREMAELARRQEAERRAEYADELRHELENMNTRFPGSRDALAPWAHVRPDGSFAHSVNGGAASLRFELPGLAPILYVCGACRAHPWGVADEYNVVYEADPWLRKHWSWFPDWLVAIGRAAELAPAYHAACEELRTARAASGLEKE